MSILHREAPCVNFIVPTYVTAAFTSEALAEEYAAKNNGAVSQVALYDRAVRYHTLYVRIAEVFPDGAVRRYRRTEEWDEPGPAPLEKDSDPWDGHTQGHCGLHVYVSGGDEAAVTAEFKRQIASAKKQMDGRCPGCGATGPYMLDWGLGGGAQEGWVGPRGKIVPSPKWQEFEAISLPMNPSKGGWVTWHTGPCTRCGAEQAGTFRVLEGKKWGQSDRYMRLCSPCYDAIGDLCGRCLIPMESEGGSKHCPQCWRFTVSVSSEGA